jgi:hypothetical protein
VSDKPTTEADLEAWSKRLMTYQTGQQWAVWADEQRLVQLCRRDGPKLWATPVGHMQEEDHG